MPIRSVGRNGSPTHPEELMSFTARRCISLFSRRYFSHLPTMAAPAPERRLSMSCLLPLHLPLHLPASQETVTNTIIPQRTRPSCKPSHFHTHTLIHSYTHRLRPPIDKLLTCLSVDRSVCDIQEKFRPTIHEFDKVYVQSSPFISCHVMSCHVMSYHLCYQTTRQRKRRRKRTNKLTRD